MLMATDWPAFAGAPAGLVRAGCGLSGLYDLDPIRLCYLNDVLGLTREQAWRNSPVHLRPPRAGRLLLLVGGAEGEEYHRQSDDLAVAWRRWGLPVEVRDLAGEDHFSIVAQLGDPASPVSRAVQGQIAAA
jgi:arylformamidase